MQAEKDEVQTALVRMEALDEKQIAESLRGRVISQFFYEFKTRTSKGGESEIVGISWAGIKHIASQMVEHGHAISVSDVRVEDVGDCIRVMAKAVDLLTKEERWGATEQSKLFASGERNQFALPLAVSKAQRNAIKQFIPEMAIQEAYKEWKKKGGIVSAEEVEAGPEPGQPAPAPSAPVQQRWEPKVSVTKEPVNITGVKQFPLIGQGNKALGMVNWVEDEASIVPENPVAMDDPALKGFLLGKVLRNMVEQKVLEYQTDAADGFLVNVVVRGKLNDQVMKELVSSARWAFEKAMGR